MNKSFLLATFMLVVVVAVYVFTMLVSAGAFRSVLSKGTAACQSLSTTGLVGPEDMVEDASGRIFISANDRLAEGGAEISSKQGIGLFVLDHLAAQPRLLTLDSSLASDFHPHGLDLYRDSVTGREKLYVINHRTDGDKLEIFLVVPTAAALVHESTLDLPFPGANDVTVWSDQRIYVTFDHEATSVFGRRLEDYSRVGRGFVALYDQGTGGSWKKVASGLAYANGIAKLKDGQHLAVAAMLGRFYRIYRVEAGGHLTQEQEVSVGAGPDNLTVDQDGTLWIAAHPKLLALKAMSQDRSKRAPSMVLRVLSPLDPNAIPEEVITDDGLKIAATSVAFRTKDARLLLGSVFDDHLLLCPSP